MSHHEAGDRLPLFQSPLLAREDTHYHGAAEETKQPQREITSMDISQGSSPQFDNDHALHNHPLHDHPQFHRHTEATNAELFYDLFFVANLTVFTNVHEVNDHETLAQYVGFFSILWFTWYQIGLYDVRFSMDSVWERIAKACQFGVMIGFAIVGPNFDVGAKVDLDAGEGPSLSSFQALTLILMASRLVLVLQYLQSLWFTRAYKRTMLPMILITTTYLVAAIIYLGLYFTFTGGGSGVCKSYVTWYIVAALETVIATTVSSVWRVISFKGTHLVERMSLLTLIILGEGVMGLAKQCQSIVKSEIFTFSSSTIGNIVSAVLILYFIYMLYFDWVQEEHFGTVRQQIWAFMHFPLHLMLVLAVEGVAQSVAWNAAVVENILLIKEYNAYNFSGTDNHIYPSWHNVSESRWVEIAGKVNETAIDVLYNAVANSKEIDQTFTIYDTLTQALNGTALIATTNQTGDYETAVNAVSWIYNTLGLVAFELAGFAAPEINTTNDQSGLPIDFNSDATFENTNEETNRVTQVYVLTFIYLFVAIGLVVVFCTFLAALSKKEKTVVHWIRLVVSDTIGLALCLISAIAVASTEASDSYAYANFVDSGCVLPTILLSLFAVVVLNSVRLPTRGEHYPHLVKMMTRSSRV